MVCGVYKIGFSSTDKVYIGSSKNIERRFKQHQAMLNADCHHSYKLQEYFNSSREHINLAILQECSEEDRTTVEVEYMSKYNAISNGFNVAEVQHISSSEAEMLRRIIEMPKYLRVYARLLDEGFSHTSTIIASYMFDNYESCSQYGIRYFESIESIAKNTRASVSAVNNTIKELITKSIMSSYEDAALPDTNYYHFDINYFMSDFIDEASDNCCEQSLSG